MGWVSLVSAGAPVFGLAIGGLMVDTLGWRPLFVIQAVLCALAFALAVVVLRETGRQEGVTLDLPGAATIAPCSESAYRRAAAVSNATISTSVGRRCHASELGGVNG